MDKISRIKGMMLGLAIGDALGAPVELGVSCEDIRKNLDTYKNLQDGGKWTDDTSMALCLAESLITCGGYDSYDVMDRYIKWRDGSENAYKGFGFGMQLDFALTSYESEKIIPKKKPREKNAGNGSLTRLAPIVIASSKMSMKDVMRLARIASRETHYSREAEVGAEIFAVMLYQALNGKEKREIIDIEGYSTGKTYDSILKRMKESLEKPASEFEELGAYVVDSLRIVAWAFMNSDSFEEGMIKVLCLGGDTDTNCAIYGQLAGAYYGVEKIPERWLGKDLYELEEIESIARKLAGLGEIKVIRTRFEEDPEFEKR